jgi:hypothetical protein
MTDLRVEGTVEDAAGSVFEVCRRLSAKTIRISSAELADMNAAELAELRQAVAAGTRDGEPQFVDWCTRMDKLIAAEYYLRICTQAAFDAKAAVIIDEERRLACQRH